MKYIMAIVSAYREGVAQAGEFTDGVGLIPVGIGIHGIGITDVRDLDNYTFIFNRVSRGIIQYPSRDCDFDGIQKG